MLRKIFNWIFKTQLTELENELIKARNLNNQLEGKTKFFEKLMDGFDISVDLHESNRYSPN